jgi:hypothetical protein
MSEEENMSSETTLILSYIAFVWLVALHTFEEISCNVMEARIGHIKMTKNKYLIGASIISTVNLVTLALLVIGLPFGLYLGLFATAIIGIFQGVIHTIGYLRENKTARGLGAGFYSALPLALVGIIVFTQLVRVIIS